MKHCPGCDQTKERSEFGKNRNRGDGLQGWCKACFRRSHAENRKARRAQQADYYQRNAEDIKAAVRKYSRENAERVRAAHAEWRERNRDKTRAHAREYVARKRAGGAMTDEDRDYWRLILDDPCAYCGGPAGEADHIHPVSKGGTNEWMNLAPTCRSCNAGKNTDSPLHFMLRR